ncbi:hypothetical protein EYF80_050737 [Liparis tanakae]|uniref:Uncharacterized protein n=1 Tax=Liparis tanakae TaxID=230148 RepID=A0A4Z2FFB0_9TELE|nr:hypothetical protein EYF80_050737 [Liparis tanakae]
MGERVGEILTGNTLKIYGRKSTDLEEEKEEEEEEEEKKKTEKEKEEKKSVKWQHVWNKLNNFWLILIRWTTTTTKQTLKTRCPVVVLLSRDPTYRPGGGASCSSCLVPRLQLAQVKELDQMPQGHGAGPKGGGPDPSRGLLTISQSIVGKDRPPVLRSLDSQDQTPEEHESVVVFFELRNAVCIRRTRPLISCALQEGSSACGGVLLPPSGQII